MEKQLIISVGREFGSGGHAIAELLAKRFDLPLYDSNLLEKIAERKSLNVKHLEKYDEIPKNRLFSRNVMGYSNSPEEAIANLQFDYLRQKADSGASFIIVGRCAEEVLKGNPALTTIFVLGDMEAKVARIMELYQVSEQKAENIVVSTNKKRKNYHNYYCTKQWGDSRNYELSINSSRLGLIATADIIEDYIRRKMNLNK